MTDFSQVNVTSNNVDMWIHYEQFPEMAVKKNRSRLSPGFVFQVTGLDPTTKYKMSVKLCAQDNFKYKYGPVSEDGVKNDKWYPTSDFGKEQDAQYVGHHWGSQTGEVWMRTGVEFLQLFLCTVPDEYSFFVEQKRVYLASLVIIDTETNVEMEVNFDFHKFVTVSSYRKQYQKPTERLPRAHGSPPVLEPLETVASQVQKRRSTKKRYNQESSMLEMKRQKVQQYVDLASEAEDFHVMQQPEEYKDLEGHFVGDQNVPDQEFQGSVAGDEVQGAYIDDNEFDSTAPVDERESDQTAQQQHQRFQGQCEFSPDPEQPHGLPADSVVYQNDFGYANHIDDDEFASTAPRNEWESDQAAPEMNGVHHVVQHQHQRFQGQFSPYLEQSHGLPADSVVYQDEFVNGNHMDDYEDDSTAPVDEWQCDQAAPEMNGFYHVTQQRHHSFQQRHNNLADHLVADEQYSGLPARSVSVDAIEPQAYEDDDYANYPMSPTLNNTQQMEDVYAAPEDFQFAPISDSAEQIEDVYHAAPDSFQMVPNLDNVDRIEEVYDDAPANFQMSQILDDIEQFENVYGDAPEDFQMAPAVVTDDVEYGQQDNNDSYDINSPGHPVLWNHASSSTQAEEAPESNGNLEFAADEYDIDQDEHNVGQEKRSVRKGISGDYWRQI